MTSEHQVCSLHYFHSYAVRDCIDLSDLSSKILTPNMSELNVADLLPSNDDHLVLLENMAFMIGCILRKHIPFFMKFGTGLGRHIFHEHYDDLSAESKVVSFVNIVCPLRSAFIRVTAFPAQSVVFMPVYSAFAFAHAHVGTIEALP